MPLPAVLTIQSGINQLRYATLKGIMAAKKKEISKAAASGCDAAPRQKIVGLYVPEKTKKTQMIAGSPAEAAKELVREAARRGAGDLHDSSWSPSSAGGKLNRATWETIAAAQQLRAMRDRDRLVAVVVLGGECRRVAAGARRGAGAGSRDASTTTGARRLHAGRLHGGARAGDRAARRRRSCCCRTPIRRATSRRSSRRGWTARSSPTSPASSATAARRRSCGRCFRAS